MIKPLPSAIALLLAASASAGGFCPADPSLLERRIVTCRDNVSQPQCRKIAESVGCSVVHLLDSINAVVITVPAQSLQPVESRLRVMTEVESVETDRKVNWLKSASLLNVVVGHLNASSLKDVIRPFKPSMTPAAPGGTADAELPWGIKRLNAPAAWAKTEGRGVKVAIIDTGVDATHPDLTAAVAGGFNAVDPKKPFKDDQGHGTHVAGTIAAAHDGKGVVGMAPQARLYAVKVLDAEGNGNFSDVIAGIEWCAKNGMQVANMSLGASEGSEALHKAVIAAAKAGVAIIAAAGNDSGGKVSFPGAYPEVITVSSSDKNDKLSDFSSVGPEVDFIAPGSDINSTMMGGGFEELSGTSMATPHVSGLAALAIASGARTPAAVKAALSAASTLLPGLTAPQQGKGISDAGRLTGATRSAELIAIAGL